MFFGHSYAYANTEADMWDAPSHVNMVGARSYYFLADFLFLDSFHREEKKGKIFTYFPF